MPKQSKIVIQRAIEADWPDIVNIYNQAVDDGHCTADTEPISIESRQHWFETHQAEPHPIYVAIIEDTIAGWSSLSPFRPGRKALAKTVEISYYLDRNQRGMGLGKRLMQYTIEAARSLGHQHLFAILLEINTPSVGLLEKFEFKRWGLMPDVVDFGDSRSGLLIYGRKI